MKKNIDIEELSVMIGQRLDLVDGIVGAIRDVIGSFPNDIIGLGPFVFAFETELKKMAEKIRESIPEEDRAIFDDPSVVTKVALAHMYLREVQLMRKEKEVKVATKSPSEEFIAAARQCIACLMNVPEAGNSVTKAQEDEHLNSLMKMSQALKKFGE